MDKTDSTPINIIPIGFVKSPMKVRTSARLKLDTIFSEIVIREKLNEALDGLEGFSHIIVLYWLDQAVKEKVRMKTHPMGREDVAEQGFFATRSPNRINPIGKTTVRLLERNGNILKVQGLDAIDGSPVIDIKPYIPGYDSAKDAKVPDWVIVEE